MDPALPSSSNSSIPLAYADPSTYLLSPKFHLSHTFTPSSLSSPITASHAFVGSPNPHNPTLVWINGLGHHRLASSLFDGICESHHVRLLTIDRPSAGLSTPVVLSERIRVSHETLFEVLKKEGITKFSILSHSNGVIYALYTLLNLPEEFECRKWFMTSPWIPASISGSIPLNLAGYVPGNVTNKLGSLAWGVQKAIGPLGVSMGLVRDWGNWSSGLISGSGSTKEPSQPRRKGTIQERIQHFESLQSLKPREEQSFGGTYYPSGMMDLGMKVVLEEGMEGMGEEARVCLRKGCEWGWVESESENESRRSEKELYERGFGALKEKRGSDFKVKVWAAGEDGLVPKRGRDWFKDLLVRLELVEEEEEGWKECRKMGHDEVLGLKFVVEEILNDVKE